MKEAGGISYKIIEFTRIRKMILDKARTTVLKDNTLKSYLCRMA